MKELVGLTPSDYLNILLRRRWYAVVAFLLVAGGVAAFAHILPDVYVSKAVIAVEQSSMPRDIVRPSDTSSPTQMISTATERIRSRSFIEPLIEEFGLAGYGKSEEFLMDDAVVTVGNHIQVAGTTGNTLTISYRATNPKLAQKVAESIVHKLIQFGSSNRKTDAKKNYDFLENQVREKLHDLNRQEEKIREFKSSHMGQLPEQKAQNADTLKQLKKDLEATENTLVNLRADIKGLEARAQNVKNVDLLAQPLYIPDSTPSLSGTNSESMPTLEADLAKKEADLSALLAKYSSKYPDVVRLQAEVDALKKRLNRRSAEAASDKSASNQLGEADTDSTLNADLFQINIETDLKNAEIEKQEKKRDSLISQIQMYEDSAELEPVLDMQLSRLILDRDQYKTQYLNAVSARDEAERTLAHEEGDTGSYSVIDEANLPEIPASPDRVRIVLMGLLAGLVMGVGASLGRELLDSTLSTEEEAAATLKMPVLVSLNEISKKDARRYESKKNIA